MNAASRHTPTTLASILIATVALRLRFLWTPITSDEGGYLAVARAWGRGAVLYRDVWVDRPQALLIQYRMLEALGVGTPVGVRLLAMLAGFVGAVACASIARSLYGPRAALPTGLVAAVLLAVPQWEGFIANAELLSGALGATGLAIALHALSTRTTQRRWYALAGAFGSLAVLTKQSALDSVVVAVVVGGWYLWRARAGRQALAALAGLGAPIAIAAVHGIVTCGWSRWWFAVAGYRLSSRNALTGADWAKLRETAGIVAPILLPALIVGGAAWWRGAARSAPTGRGGRGVPRRAAAIAALWLATATLAFFGGGLFHRHYWVVLMFPMSVVIGIGCATFVRAQPRLLALAAALAAPLAFCMVGITMPRSEVGPRLDGDRRFAADEAIAAWFAAHRQPGETIYALCASAGLYGNVDTDPPYPYLWFLGVRDIPGARALLASTLDAATRPRYVAMYQSAGGCDPSGATERALAAHYSPVATVSGVQIVRSHDG